MGIVLLLLSFLSFECFSSGVYSLADLEVLAKDNNHSEFFEHALDIRPSERQDSWKAMVIKLGDSYTREILNKASVEPEDFQKVERLYSWTTLKADDVFRLRRQQIGLSYLKSCLKSLQPCWRELKDFWQVDKSDADTAYKLAELTLGMKNAPITTWSLLEVSLKSPLSEFYCKKEFVMDALWGKIEINYVKLGAKGDLMKSIDRIVHPDCVPSLISTAKSKLYSPPKKLDRELAFQVLNSQLKATEEVRDFFYTVYLLDNPAKGELFNYSWNRIKELSKSAARREKVLRKLKRLDPLPDGILSTLDQSKKKVVLRHLKSHFPEYIDHYFNQCIQFYSGKGTFPRGNPTVNCQSFMSSDTAPLILEQAKLREFQEAKKI